VTITLFGRALTGVIRLIRRATLLFAAAVLMVSIGCQAPAPREECTEQLRTAEECEKEAEREWADDAAREAEERFEKTGPGGGRLR